MMFYSAFLLAAVLSAQAETDIDSKWLPWMGCWTLVEDAVKNPPFGKEGETTEEGQPRRGLVCVVPHEDGGVRMTAFAGEEAFLEETLVADGSRRPVQKGTCTGWQRTDWSRDGHRLYSKSELTCEDGQRRAVSGMSMMFGFSRWLEIETVGDGGGRAVFVRQYRPASARETVARTGLSEELMRDVTRARVIARKPLDVEDVVEAKDFVDPYTLEAAMVEAGEGFELDSNALLELDDADLPPSMIDLMVALSYPDYFEVKAESADSITVAGIGGFGTPTIYGATSPYGFSSYPYYYAPFGSYYRYAPSHPVYVVRPPSISTSRSVGRVVKDRGYVRVTPRAPTSKGYSSRGGGSGGGGSVGRSGYSGGGSSGSTGRTAKPRPRNDSTDWSSIISSGATSGSSRGAVSSQGYSRTGSVTKPSSERGTASTSSSSSGRKAKKK